jgi:predicted nucleotidyltransferase component of viral defense system
MFDDRAINILAYTLETILAEKLETIVSRGIANTRPRDFYDIFILWKMRSDEVSPIILREALQRTAEKRESLSIMNRYDSILSDVLSSEQMHGFWTRYQTDYDYAADITFGETIEAAKEILGLIGKS